MELNTQAGLIDRIHPKPIQWATQAEPTSSATHPHPNSKEAMAYQAAAAACYRGDPFYDRPHYVGKSERVAAWDRQTACWTNTAETYRPAPTLPTFEKQQAMGKSLGAMG